MTDNNKEYNNESTPWLKRQIRDSFKLRPGSYYDLMRKLSPEDALSIDEILNNLKIAGFPEKYFPKHYQGYLEAAQKAQKSLDDPQLIKLTHFSPYDAMLLYQTEILLRLKKIKTNPSCIYTLALLIEHTALKHEKIKKYLPLAQIKLPP
jgi:hypothetical protein